MKAPLPAGVMFLNVMHDNDCPGADGEPEACCCNPDVEWHQDEGRFIRSVTQNRDQRRAAKREADAAMRRAARR